MSQSACVFVLLTLTFILNFEMMMKIWTEITYNIFPINLKNIIILQ